MKKIWLIIIIAIAAGLLLSIIGISLGASRTLYLDTTGFYVDSSGETKITETLDEIKNIRIDAGSSDIEIVIGDTFGIDLYGNNLEWLWSYENGSLVIWHDKGTRFQIMNINIFPPYNNNYVRVYIPEDAVLDFVTVIAGSGDIKINGVTTDSITASTRTGEVKLNNIISEHIQVEMSSGNLVSENINTRSMVYNNSTGDGIFKTVNAETIMIQGRSGDLRFTDCLFDEIGIINTTGSIHATNLTSMRASINNRSGDIRLSGTFTGESIIQATTGDIVISTSLGREEYSYDISLRTGSITFDGERLRDQSAVTSGNTAENHMKLTTTSGDIKVEFAR